MKRIAFIMSSLFACGGEERVVTLIANELSQFYDVTIYTYENRKLEGGKKNNYKLSEKVRVEEVTTENEKFWSKCIKIAYAYTGLTKGKVSQRILKDVFYPKTHLEEWVDRINREQFDLVIAVSGTYTILLGYIADKITTPCISWEHSSFEGYFDRHTGYYKNRMEVYKQCASKLKARVVLNNDIARKYKSELGLTTCVIPNPKSFSSEEKADMSQKCFVTCGRLETEKGYDDLIRAFSAFHKHNKEWKLRIIGGGRLENSLKLLIQDNKLEDKVEITGYVNEVQENLLKGSVFLMTSRWEGFPMTITEALEMGLPVIAYGIPAIEPLVTDGREGIIVQPFNRDEFVQAMIYIAENENIRKEMSQKAIEKAKTLEPEKVVQKWVALIDNIISGNK